MRTIISIMVVGVAAIGLMQPALAAEQTTTAEVSKPASDTWNNIKSYSVDKKSEAVAYGKKLLKESDARIAELEVKASKVSGAAKTEYDRQLINLKAARTDTAAKLARMEKASGNAWDDAKQGFADAYKDLERAYGKVVGSSK